MKHFHYDLVPPTFLHCITEDCPLQTDCLRQIAYQHLPSQIDSVHIVNLRKLASVNKNNCPYFFKVQPVRYAKGFKHVLDSLPHKDVRKLKDELIAYFGHSKYYRCLRKERFIHPTEQKAMHRIFEDRGFPDTLHFELYIDSFVFQ